MGEAAVDEAACVAQVPLAVDLDGTLVRTDTLAEGILSLLHAHPLALLRLPLWLARGRAALKAEVAARAGLDAAALPYDEALLDFLAAERQAGRRLILVTAADARVAQAVAAHLGLFDEILASDGAVNLKGAAKARLLVQRFGGKGFDYAGDCAADLAVWAQARRAVVVHGHAALARRAGTLCAQVTELGRRPAHLPAMARALRPHQWVKNILLFVPLLAAGAFTDGPAWLNTALAALAFCLTASAVYVCNDLLDLQADRRHSHKRLRPFAHGDLPVTAGLSLAPLLLAAGLALGGLSGVAGALAVYAFLSSAYSLRLKEFPLMDAFVLTGLYSLRVLAGAMACGHGVSLWLLGFCFFLFLSLSLIKRSAELRKLAAEGRRTAARRGYVPEDEQTLRGMGVAASFASGVIMSLYVQSMAAGAAYSNPVPLWGMVPLLVFWQCRLWLSTARGYMHHDPIVYAMRDWVSWATGIALLTLVALARLLPPWTEALILLPPGAGF